MADPAPGRNSSFPNGRVGSIVPQSASVRLQLGPPCNTPEFYVEIAVVFSLELLCCLNSGKFSILRQYCGKDERGFGVRIRQETEQRWISRLEVTLQAAEFRELVTDGSLCIGRGP